MDLAHLIDRAQKGDLEAYGALVQRFQAMAFRYAQQILGDVQLAEDAVQEAFAEVYVQLPNLRYPAALSIWLRRIVFKHCDRLSRKKQLAVAPLEAADELVWDGADPAEATEGRWLSAQVMAAVEKLSGFERRLIGLFYFEARSQKEISALLDLPLTTVKNRLHATRQQLRERMEGMVKDQRTLSDSAFATDLAQTALAHYGIEGSQLKFNRGKMRVEVGNQETPNAYVLRFHYPAYMDLDEAWYTKAAIESELMWLDALKRDLGLAGQEVVSNRSGEVLTQLAGDGLRWPLYCTLLRRVKGDFVDDYFPADAQTRNLGAMLARIHQHGSTWARPAGFSRPAWDWDFLHAFLRRLRPAVEEGLISSADYAALEGCMARLKGIIDRLGRDPQHWGLIHGALFDDRYYVDGDRALPIDFSACGFGYYYKDIAHCLNHLSVEKRRLLLEGYQEIRSLPSGHLEGIGAFNIAARIEDNAHFFLNPDEPKGWEAGLVALAREGCKQYLEGKYTLVG